MNQKPDSALKSLEDETEADVSLLDEAAAAVEILLLHAAPVYYGLGVPKGDGSAVVLVPGFLSADLFLMDLYGWLRRIGYRPYFSGINLNAECPNLLIQNQLGTTIKTALAETGRKIHLIGHSLGGVISRSVAGQIPGSVASVIMLAAPIRGPVAHRSILRAATMIRNHILSTQGAKVMPDCYTPRCTCNFLDHVRRDVPDSVRQTSIYTRTDGVVDWHCCLTGDADIDFEVSGTHIGLVFNPSVYVTIANRLAEANTNLEKPRRRKRRK